MKRIALFTVAIMLLASCGYKRMGSLTMVSTRNVESSIQYVELARKVEGKTKLKRDDALQEAIDEAVNSVPGGEYMTNVVVYIKGDRMIKVTGDVYGSTEAKAKKEQVPDLVVGQKVMWIDDKNRTVESRVKQIDGDRYVIQIVFNKKEYVTTRDRIIKKGQ